MFSNIDLASYGRRLRRRLCRRGFITSTTEGRHGQAQRNGSLEVSGSNLFRFINYSLLKPVQDSSEVSTPNMCELYNG